MSRINNRVNAKSHAFLSIVAVLVLSLMSAGIAQAKVPVPSNFKLVSEGKGVKIYKATNSKGGTDYVTVVDLRYATLQSYTGWAYPDGSVERRSLTTHWNNAVAQNRNTKVAINGTFFADKENGRVINPTGISFGLKANWWRMSYGFDVGKDKPFYGQILTFAYNSSFGSSSIQSYSRDTFDGGVPDVVGGLTTSANKDKNSAIARTFVGVRDDNGDRHSETVVFFTSTAATQSMAVDVLSGFGTGSKIMLDGGGSTGLIFDGKAYIPTSRTLPQVFIITAGK